MQHVAGVGGEIFVIATPETLEIVLGARITYLR